MRIVQFQVVCVPCPQTNDCFSSAHRKFPVRQVLLGIRQESCRLFSDWLNDEKNVLTEFNTAEAKGLARPMTHLITLNQSDRERKEHTMRLNVAKSRFFEKGEPFKIATDYDNEKFYDQVRTMNINKVG